MSVIQRSYHCDYCQQKRLFTQQQMNHVPHILATVFLCGLWLPLWLLSAIFYNAKFHCTACGSTPHRQDGSQKIFSIAYSLGKIINLIVQWFSGLNKLWKGVVIGSLILIYLIVGTTIKMANTPNEKDKQVSISSPTPIIKSTPSQISNSETAASQSSKSDYLESASDRLERVKSVIKYENKFTSKDYIFIYSQLYQIPPDAPEYQEAQSILFLYKRQIDSARKKAK